MSIRSYSKKRTDQLLAAAVATAISGAVAEAQETIDLAPYVLTSSLTTILTNLIGTAPANLDTLQEIAVQLASDESAVSALITTVSGKQPIDPSLTALANLVTAPDKAIYFTAADSPATYDLTSYGRQVVATANAAALRTLLALGSAATAATSDFDAAGVGVSAAAAAVASLLSGVGGAAFVGPVTAPNHLESPKASFDGGSTTPTVGTKVRNVVAVAGTIFSASVIAAGAVAGSATVTVKKQTLAQLNAGTASTLILTATLSAALGSLDSSLNIAVAAGDVFEFELTSVTTVTRFVVTLNIWRA